MRSVWLFVITTAVVVIGLVIGLYFIFNEDAPETEPEETVSTPETESGTDVPETKITGEKTLLLIGTDYQPDILHDYDIETHVDEEGRLVEKREISADAIILVKFSADRNFVLLCVLPSDMYLNYYSTVTLGSSFAEGGAAYTAKCVSELTGLKIDNVVTTSIPKFTEALSKLGQFTVNVPVDMKYSDPWQGLEIDLKRGTQLLSADQLMQLIRFDSYPDGRHTRESTILSVAESLLSKVTGKAFSSKAVSLFKEILPYFETDYTADDLAKDLPMFLTYQTLDKKSVRFPVKKEFRNGEDVFVPDGVGAVNVFGEYK